MIYILLTHGPKNGYVPCAPGFATPGLLISTSSPFKTLLKRIISVHALMTKLSGLYFNLLLQDSNIVILCERIGIMQLKIEKYKF